MAPRLTLWPFDQGENSPGVNLGDRARHDGPTQTRRQ